MLNRGVMIVSAKEPLVQWLKSLPDPCDMTLEEINTDCTAYLVPGFECEQEREKFLKKCFGTVFENELAEWWTHEEDWPQKRDLRTFRKWFDLRYCSVVEDLVDDVLVDE